MNVQTYEDDTINIVLADYTLKYTEIEALRIGGYIQYSKRTNCTPDSFSTLPLTIADLYAEYTIRTCHFLLIICQFNSVLTFT